ncbi:MAG TPA: carbohydrate ABC transporter permease [Candidatus Eisenbergiella merdipullorum]|uniref:Carbohydrate ABC transporter permease n=1 Tax=Candidatus Eisenbergiella merdipullorum TaxID=2838553 RepID=A0A9D2I839_9FIRM|nr:carbohydrate ABC transporter permease [Candidatus Eisenbergiella merdipullorum]
MVKRRVPHGTKVKESLPERIFAVCNYIILTVIALLMLYPIINIIAVSFSNYTEYLKTPWMIWPRKITTDAYRLVFHNRFFWRSYLNTILVTAGSTVLSLVVTTLFAWPMARKELKGKPFLMAIMIFTMIFNAGMIPGYLNIQDLHLLDTLWALILPGTFNTFNCVIMMSFFRELPYELVEAAMVDGATEPYVLTKLVIPLSKPVIASITLFLAVGAWNSYFAAQIYIRDRDLWPMALTLKEILVSASTQILEAASDPSALQNAQQEIQSKNIQYASVVVSTLPIMCIYPFLQKYFAKGVMVGSVKG